MPTARLLGSSFPSSPGSSSKPSTLGPLRSFAGNLFSAVTNDAARVPSLTSLDVPVHIVWGARDANLNLSVADALHQEIPHSTLTVFPNAHHNLMLDDPTQFRSNSQIRRIRIRVAQRTRVGVRTSVLGEIHTGRNRTARQLPKQ